MNFDQPGGSRLAPDAAKKSCQARISGPGLVPAVLLFLAWAELAADGDDLRRYSRSEPHMAVEFEVVLYATSAAKADEAFTKAMARIAQLDKALSDYDPDSELSKLSE